MSTMPGPLKRFLLTAFIKSAVVGSKPYKRNSPTVPVFKIVDRRNFADEKQRLIAFLNRVQQQGEKKFDGRESMSLARSPRRSAT